MDKDHKENHSHYNGQLRPLAYVNRNKMTKSEACMWKYVLRAGMMKGYTFRRQRPVDIYIADFMCRELNLIIEVDGLTHDNNDAIARDVERQTRLEELGFSILRFTSNEVLQHVDAVRNSIKVWIEEQEPL